MKFLKLIILVIITMTITLPKGILALGFIESSETITLQTFLDIEEDSSDDRPEENCHEKKVDAAETFFALGRYDFSPKLTAITFLERLPTMNATYIADFHIPPSC